MMKPSADAGSAGTFEIPASGKMEIPSFVREAFRHTHSTSVGAEIRFCPGCALVIRKGTEPHRYRTDVVFDRPNRLGFTTILLEQDYTPEELAIIVKAVIAGANEFQNSSDLTNEPEWREPLEPAFAGSRHLTLWYHLRIPNGKRSGPAPTANYLLMDGVRVMASGRLTGSCPPVSVSEPLPTHQFAPVT